METTDRIDPNPDRDVCSLASDELRDRRAMIQREIAPHVRRSTELANGLAWEFDRDPAVRAKLVHLIDLERRCCGGLAWSLEEPERARTLRLVVTGVDPRSELFAAFRSAGRRPRAGNGALARAVRAIGFGVGGSLLVCCILPGAVALVAGAAVAAPLARFDDPVAIGAASVAAAAGSWLWMRRRALACEC